MSFITLTDLKSYAGIDGAADDTLLTLLIDAAQKVIEDDRGYAFEASADSTRYFTVGVNTEGKVLYFDQWCCAITTIKTDADAASPVTLATTEYITRPRNIAPYHAVQLLSSSDNSWTYTTNPEKGIEVTGRWAWSTTAPANIQLACKILVKYLYTQKDAGVFDTTAMPDAGVIQVPQGIPKTVRKILDLYPKGFGT